MGPDEDFLNSAASRAYATGCFYTRVSGIWQTEWMEEVAETYVESYKVTPDIDKGEVSFTFKTVGEELDEDVKVEIFDADGSKVASGKADATQRLVINMPKDFKLWSPESPNLYTFKAKFEKDAFEGYFGMRKFSKARQGRLPPLRTSTQALLHSRPLDQGWGPTACLRPPRKRRWRYASRVPRTAASNNAGKHIKSSRCATMRSATRWASCAADMPSGSAAGRPQLVDTVKRYGFYREELKQMMDNLYSVPSIVMWVPYNEGWTQPGQFLTHSTLDFVRRYDPTRLVNGPSGCWDWEGGHLLPEGWNWEKRVQTQHKPAGECEAADAVDMHLYRGPTMFDVNDRRVSFLGEFGGLGHPVQGHLWKEPKDGKGNWGYGGIEDTKTLEGLEKTYLGLDGPGGRPGGQGLLAQRLHAGRREIEQRL